MKRSTFGLRILAVTLAMAALVNVQSCLSGNDKKSNPVVPGRGYYAISFTTVGAFPYPVTLLHLDSTYDIRWNRADSIIAAFVRIELYRGDTLQLTLSNGYATPLDTGFFRWNLAGLRPPRGSGPNYRIKITSTTDTTEWEYSPNFTIYSNYSGSISITSPTAATVVQVGTQLQTSWTANGSIGTGVQIAIYRGDTLISGLATGLSSGTSNWTVSAGMISSTNYRIRIHSLNDPAIYTFSPYFRITTQFFGTLTVTTPGLAASLNAGTTSSIAWTTSGSPGTSVMLQLFRDSSWVSTIISGLSTASTPYGTWAIPAGLPTSARYRIRISSVQDAGIFSLSEYFTITGITPDAYELDNQRILAKIITDSTSQSRTISYMDSDWVQINTAPGRRYLAGVQSAFLLHVFVADSNGVVQSTTTGTQLQVPILPAYSGRYYVMVRHYDNPSTAPYQGAYSLSLRGYDSTQSSSPVTFTEPGAGVTWSAGSLYNIGWVPDTLWYNPNVTLKLYRDSVHVLTLINGTANDGSYSWQIPPGMPTSSNYRLRIENFSNPQIYSYSPVFTISGTALDSYESDNTRLSAKVILDSTTQARTLTYTDSDWVQINATAGRRYVAGIQSTLTSMTVYVLDSNGVQLNFSTGANHQIFVTPTYVGRYYLRVQYASTLAGYQGSYNLNLRSYDVLTGFPVTFISPTAGATLNSGSTYSIDWVPDSVFYGAFVNFALYRDTILIQTFVTGTANDGSYPMPLASGLTTGGNYRVRIANNSNTQIFAYSPNFTISGINADAFEPDNVRGAASAIPDSTTQSRTLTLSDTDWVLINAMPGRRYLAGIQSALSSIYVYVHDSNGVQLGLVSSGANQQIFVTPTYVGRYYLRVQYVSTTAGYQGSYNLSLRSYDVLTGFPVTFTSPSAGATLSSGFSYNINWVPDSVFYGTFVNFALYRDTTFVQTLWIGTANDGVQSMTLATGLTTAGNYRIRITNNSNTQIFAYSPNFTVAGIVLDAYEPDNVRGSAGVIADSTTQPRTLTMSDTDWVQINAAAGRRYVVGVQSALTSLNVYVYDSIGVQIGVANTGLPNYQIFVIPTYVGRYYVRVLYASTGAGYQGPYNLSLRSYDVLTGFPVTFTSPAAGATLNAGSSYSINWVPDSAFYGTLVNFILYRDTIAIQAVWTGTANDGIQTWTLAPGLTTGANYRLRIVNNSNTQIFAFSPTFSISGVNADAFEPDNVRLLAGVIPDSTTQARTLTYMDTDWVQINAAPGRRYLANVQSTLSSIYVYVHDSNGVQIGALTTGANQQVFVTPTYLGRYYVRILHASTLAGYQGPYNLTLRSYDLATGFPVNFSSPAAGAVLNAGTSHTLGWTPDSLLYGALVNFILYRDSTAVQTIINGTANDGSHAWIPAAGLTTGSNYRIRIVNSNNTQIFAYSPIFTINGVNSDAYEPDNVRLTAKTILDGTTQSRTLTLSDSDWVQITTVAGYRYLASVQAGFWLNVYVLDSNGVLLSSSTTTASHQISMPTTYSGRYYLRIQYYSTGTGYQGSYSLSLFSYPTTQPGFPITFTAPTAGATLTAGTSTTVTWVRDSVIYGNNVIFHLYRDTVQLYAIQTTLNSGTYTWNIQTGLATAGNYRLRIANSNNTQVFGFSPLFNIAGMPQDALEPNDTSGSASVLLPNQGRSQLSLTYLDRDWFSFTGTAGRIYIIRTISTITTTVTLHSGLGGAQLATSTKAATDSVNNITWYCPTNGQYSFQVTASTTGNYALEFQEYTGLTLSVTAPALGDTATRNLVIPIRWNSVADIRGNVDIYLYRGLNVIQPIMVNGLNTGLYNWRIPTDTSALPAAIDYTIRVISRIHSSIQGNSGNFQIINQACATNCGSVTTWDFESTNGGFTNSGTYLWGYGTPTFTGGPMGAHSGTRVWGTSLSSSYSSSATYSLVSPSFVVPAAGTLSFWHWMTKESCCDYGYVEISVNGGATYSILATYTAATTGGWVQATFNLAAYAGQNAILRWRFTTDGSVTSYGWFIDDIDVR